MAWWGVWIVVIAVLTFVAVVISMRRRKVRNQLLADGVDAEQWKAAQALNKATRRQASVSNPFDAGP